MHTLLTGDAKSLSQIKNMADPLLPSLYFSSLILSVDSELQRGVFGLASAAMTKYQRPGGLPNKKSFSYSSRG